ncbi:MAG TPA: peptidase M16, partial [Prevotella sp.]|nr:peptidase M16 [Prevotella sp.]
MKKILVTLFLIIALTPAAWSAQLVVPQDSSFRIGHLKNGMTYYIRYNSRESGIADFYIAQRVGSILEKPNQRGLAHFLEHMAFNGSQNFQGTPESPGIVHWCEAHGIKFGANLNAYTSVDETVYHISAVPVTHEPNIDSCLLILHDWSHYLDLSDKEIDKERGVIHEEWRTR